jgi:hypothetical protein
VLQEVTLARSCTFLVGSHEFSWTDLHLGLGQIDADDERGGDNSRPRDTLAVIDYLRQRPRQLDLLELLERVRGYQTTDPRDKVYALLGLLDNSRDLDIRADYTKSTESLFAEVTRTIIEHSSSLEILSYAAKTSPRQQASYSLPSWVPDWTQRRTIIPLWSRLFQADRNSVVQLRRGKEAAKLHLAAVLAQSSLQLYESPWLDQEWASDGIEFCDKRMAVQFGKDVVKKLDLWAVAEMLADYSGNKSSWKDVLGSWACAGAMLTAGNEWVKYDPSWRIENETNSQAAEAYYVSVAMRTGGRRAFCTDKGGLGIGPSSAKHGDVIAVLPGGRVPFILRQSTHKSNEFLIIGECYVNDSMEGRAMDSSVGATDIVLI